MCVTLSLSVHVFAFYEVTRIAVNEISTAIVYGVFYVPFALMAFWSLFMAYTSNPGAVPMGAKPLRSGMDVQMRGIRRCRKCNDNFKPPRAHHDSNTGRCVVKMDHYCPWICNAVGVYNHKFFILFILYSCLTCVTSLILTTVTYFRCEAAVLEGGKTLPPTELDVTIIDWKRAAFSLVGDVTTAPTTTPESSSAFDADPLSASCTAIVSVEALVLFVLSILFLLFTLSMLVEQYDAMKSNISKIARLIIKRDGSNVITDGYDRVSTKFNEIFGGDDANFAWHWLLPIPVWFPDGMHDQVMGFTYDRPDDDDDGGSEGRRPFRFEDTEDNDTELSISTPPSVPPSKVFGLSKRGGEGPSLSQDSSKKEERLNLIENEERPIT